MFQMALFDFLQQLSSYSSGLFGLSDSLPETERILTVCETPMKYVPNSIKLGNISGSSL